MLFLAITRTVLASALTLAVGTDARTVCRDATGVDHGDFYTFWHDGGEGCMRLLPAGGYTVEWHLREGGNLVAGKGWSRGTPDRIVRYKAHAFEAGTNGYLALYGWSTRPLVEYYVVDNWGGFTPPGTGAVFLGSMSSDGGTYRLYRTRRIDQPSIAGIATFDQYWSVRTVRRAIGGDSVITFGNHVAGWRKAGLALGTPGYQVLATEGFSSTGRSNVTVSDR